jgi:hypothetical protein
MSEVFSYSDSFKNAVVKELVSTAAKSISSLFKKKVGGKKLNQESSFEDKLITNHFNELFNWSKDLEFIGLASRPINSIIKTIQLNYQPQKPYKYDKRR